MKSDQWLDVIQTNLNSNYQIIKTLLPIVIKGMEKLLEYPQLLDLRNPGQANYVASKSGMVGLYKSIAIEVAKKY